MGAEEAAAVDSDVADETIDVMEAAVADVTGEILAQS